VPSLDKLRIKRLAREGIWIVIGQFASVLGALVLVRVLTERLDPTQYGQLALGLTVAGLVNQVVMGGVGNGISRYYSIAAEKQDIFAYLRSSRSVMFYATLAVLAIGLMLLGGLLFLGYSQWMGLAAVALLFSILNGYNSALSGIQNAARQRAIVAFHGGLNAWLKILFSIGVLYWLGNSSTVVVIGYTLSSLLVTGSQFIFLRRLILRQSTQSEGSGNHWRQKIWVFSWPFSTWGLFTWAQQSSDRWALGAFGSTQDVGFYAVLFQLGYTPIMIVTGLAVSFFSPILYQRAGDATDYSRNINVHRLTWKIVVSSLIITITGFLLALGLHSWVFRLLVAEEYGFVSYLLPWVVLAGGVFAAGQILAMKLMSEMKSAKMSSIKVSTAIIGVLFNIYGALFWGLEGIVGALIAFSAIYFFWMVWLTFRAPSKSLNLGINNEN